MKLKMHIISVKMPRSYIDALDGLVRRGLYSSRSEAVRAAVRLLLSRELTHAHRVSSKRARVVEVV